MRSTRNAIFILVLTAVVTSVVLIAFDTHEVAFASQDCSVCKVKKTLNGASQKSLYADAVVTSRLLHPYAYCDKLHGNDPLITTERAVISARHDRAPPFFS